MSRELRGHTIHMGTKPDNNIFKHLLKILLLQEVQTLWATHCTALLRVDDAISTLLSIFKISFFFFCSSFYFTMWLFYDLTAHQSIECHSVLVYRRSHESLLTLYCALFGGRKWLYKYMWSNKEDHLTNPKRQQETQNMNSPMLLTICSWGCAIHTYKKKRRVKRKTPQIKKLLLGTRGPLKKLWG